MFRNNCTIRSGLNFDDALLLVSRSGASNATATTLVNRGETITMRYAAIAIQASNAIVDVDDDDEDVPVTTHAYGAVSSNSPDAAPLRNAGLFGLLTVARKSANISSVEAQ